MFYIPLHALLRKIHQALVFKYVLSNLLMFFASGAPIGIEIAPGMCVLLRLAVMCFAAISNASRTLTTRRYLSETSTARIATAGRHSH